jgi:peptidoglycan/LPS O-acetylase OafA/YrhL
VSGVVANTEAKKMQDCALFDWLRFLLASAVVLAHEGVFGWPQIGNLAVQVFFALSGWLIGGILLRTKPAELPRFYFNRATRIWIPYAFAVAVLYAVSMLRQPLSTRWLEFLTYDVTFTHNWFSLRPDAAIALAHMPLKGTGNHFWSIAVEEQFYLAAPLLIVFSKFGKRSETWLVVLLAALWLDTNFASISTGVFAASLRARFGDWHLRVMPLLIGVATVIGVIMRLRDDYYWITAPLFAICIVLLAARPTVRGALGKLVGGISFPLYLNAWMGGFVVNAFVKRSPFLIPAIADAILTYTGAVSAGAATFLLIDRNVMAKRDEFYSRQLGMVVGCTAYGLVLSGLCFGLIRWRLL